jgi:hypothetical protein
MYKSILFAGAVVLLLSCKEDILVPDLSGNLVGYVLTYDEFGSQTEEKGDIHITATGNKTYSTLTDGDGRFEFKGLPAGTYELTAEKEGFGTGKKINIKHLGGKPTIVGLRFDGSTWDAFHLCHLPLTTVASMVFENDSLTGTFVFPEDPPYLYQQVLIYLSDQDDYATATNFKIIARFFYNKNGNYKCPVNNALLGFAPGTTIHFKIKICSNWGLVFESNHIDFIENNTLFNYETTSYFYAAMGAESDWFSYVVPD